MSYFKINPVARGLRLHGSKTEIHKPKKGKGSYKRMKRKPYGTKSQDTSF